MPHSIINRDAYFGYFNKVWGIPKSITSFPYIVKS